MNFASPFFLFVFFPIVVGGYYLLPRKLKNLWLLALSYFFYWVGSPEFLLILIGASIFDYLIAKSGSSKLINLAIITNLIILGYFKYRGFFIEQLNLSGLNLPIPELILPLGLSFFIFQKISFLLDIKRKTIEIPSKITDYLLYIALFPQLIAGPIIQFNQIASQLREREHSTDKILNGLTLFAIGLAQKVLIADPLGNIVAEISTQPEVNFITLLVGIFCFSLQIYMDFSGYSRMAIGLAQIFGFSFPQNFNYPYRATSITEFWRRWHISLSSFFKTYVYIPLGGNRLGFTRTYTNILIVFFLTGLWHGAAWNFIIWGGYFGLFLCIEKSCQSIILPPPIKWFVTFVLILIGWGIFIFDKLPTSIQWTGSLHIISISNYEVGAFLLGWVFALYKVKIPTAPFYQILLILIFFIASIAMLSVGSVSSFLYFQF